MGIRVLAICLRLGTGLRGQRQGLVCHKGRQGLVSFFEVFVGLLRRKPVRAREAFGHVFFLSYVGVESAITSP